MKYGFVYIWFDRKHKRYYIGSHWGTKDDGYICSSRWMRNSYKRRPNDFKRKILKYITTNRNELLNEEFKWLQLIDDNDLGKKYYNLTKHLNGHWSTDEERRKSVGQKISESPDRRSNISKSMKGRKPSEYTQQRKVEVLTGRKASDETKKKMSDARTGFRFTEETKNKMRKPKTKVTCPFCNKEGGISQMKRWHFNNCNINIKNINLEF